MILVDIEVPILEKVYDIQLDENTPTCFLIEDIVGMICQKEQLRLSGLLYDMTLWHKAKKQLLEPGRTLIQYGIVNGETLILI